MVKINERCHAQNKNNYRCKKFVTKVGNHPNLHPYCSIHLKKYEYKDFGCCCFCMQPCNELSQACGRCMHNTY